MLTLQQLQSGKFGAADSGGVHIDWTTRIIQPIVVNHEQVSVGIMLWHVQ
jgi:hypothetical protein